MCSVIASSDARIASRTSTMPSLSGCDSCSRNSETSVDGGMRTRRSISTRYRPPPMFVLLLSYVRPVEEVDALMRQHMAWVSEQYDAGRFVVSGRQVPRTGGVIVARGDDRDEIERIAASD